MAKTTNTDSVMISWMIFNCDAEYTELPQRLAGTCSRYSKNAMPQLTRMTSSSGLVLNFKWPYHANVMKTFEQVSSTIGSQRDWVRSFINLFFGNGFAQCQPRAVPDVQNVN